MFLRPESLLARLTPLLLCLLMLPAPAASRTPPPQYPEVAMALAADLDRQLVPRLGMYTANNSRGLYWLVITTPADLGDLTRADPMARLLGQELASAFVNLGYNVQDLRRASDIIMRRAQGEFALTRDSHALARRQATASLVVAATYTITPSEVRYCVEVLDARNNNVVAMSCRSLPMDGTVGALTQNGGGVSTPTVSTTNAAQYRRDIERSMARHW